MSMNLVLDFAEARETSCHCYTGVRARIGGGEEKVLTITPEGCRSGTAEGATTPCEDPVVDRTQAWAVAVLLTGNERVAPCGAPVWDPSARRMEVPMRSGTRRPITD